MDIKFEKFSSDLIYRGFHVQRDDEGLLYIVSLLSPRIRFHFINEVVEFIDAYYLLKTAHCDEN